jgi:hypothetical protein
VNREDFVDFVALLKDPVQHRKTSKDGNLLNWRKVKWLHFEKASLGIVCYKTSLNNGEFQEVSFLRRSKPVTFTPNEANSGPTRIERKEEGFDGPPQICISLFSQLLQGASCN